MALTHMSPGLSWVFHRRWPVAASRQTTAHESSVCRAGLSGVGCRGAVFTSVPKNSELVSGSWVGVDQTLLVAGPEVNRNLPQPACTTTGGSSFWGFGPTSNFHTSLPDFGSTATTNPRPVLPLYPLVPANVCSRVPPPNTTLPSASIGEDMNRLLKWASGNSLARASTVHRSFPVAASRQYISPPVSAKYTAPSATRAEEKMPASDAAPSSLPVIGSPAVGGSTALRAGLRYTHSSLPSRPSL